MCAMLTCGPVFDINAISDDKGYAFGWLDALIGSQNDKVRISWFLRISVLTAYLAVFAGCSFERRGPDTAAGIQLGSPEFAGLGDR